MNRGDATECRDCNAPIRWATTNNGRRTLLDAEPDQVEGNVALLTVPTYGTESIEVAVALKDDEGRGVKLLQQAREGGVPLRRVHFLTCPARKAAAGG